MDVKLLSKLVRVIGAGLLILPLVIAEMPLVSAQTNVPFTIYDIKWSPDSQWIAAATSEGIHIYNSTTRATLRTLPVEVLGITWSPDSQFIVSGGWDKKVRIWTIASTTPLATLDGHVDMITALDWHPDGTRLYSLGLDGGLLIWDTSTNSYSKIEVILAGGYDFQISPDGTEMAIAAGSVGILNIDTKMPVANLIGHSREVLGISWSPNGSQIASVGWDGELRVWDIETRSEDYTKKISTPFANAVEWSPDGRYIATIFEDGYIRLLSPEDGEVLHILDQVSSPLTWSPDGTKLAFIAPDGTLGIVPIPGEISCAATQIITAGDVAGLITAINTANASADADVIGLATGTYTFTSINNNRNALPRITTDITICSTDGATVTRSPSAPQFRFFEVRSTGNLTLENLTLTNGSLGVDDDGGTIFNLGTLAVNNVTFSNNQAGVGGAIASEDGQVSVTDSTFTNNTSTGDGGAIHSEADLLIESSTFTGNSADDAGAVNNDGGTLTITDTRLENNSATTRGGAIYSNSSGTMSAHNSCISGNSATAVYAASTGLQDFTGNWWGAANGPGGAGPGSGDTINSKINHANFLTTGCPLP